ncbi:hypothetical protein MKX03_020173 [Papaver bracteatum]|nr:hypothetical protein MKX03_020173 [Papaver bracteatum]
MSESSNSLTAGIGMGGRTTYSEKDLKITEEILKSEDELLALYWKWISIYRRKDYDFRNKKFINLEFEKMFTERFEKFKDTVRMIHTINTKGVSWTAGFNHMTDFTDNEKSFY